MAQSFIIFLWWSIGLWGCLSVFPLCRVSSEPKKELVAERADKDSDQQGQGGAEGLVLLGSVNGRHGEV